MTHPSMDEVPEHIAGIVVLLEERTDDKLVFSVHQTGPADLDLRQAVDLMTGALESLKQAQKMEQDDAAVREEGGPDRSGDPGGGPL